MPGLLVVSRRILFRAATVVAMFLVLSAIVFIGTDALPGDAAEAILGREATPERLAELRAQNDLDRPVLERYADWLSGLTQGDLGTSLVGQQPVSEIISDKLENTAVLTLATMALLVPAGVLLGIASAVRTDRAFDHTVSGITLALIATPEFVVGAVLAVVFGVWLGVLPAVSLVDPGSPIYRQPDIFVLPVLTLLAGALAQMIRMVRASMLDVLRSEYVQMARLKGAPEHRVLLFHALPNALGPTFQIIALNIGFLVGGVVVVETVFSFPGLGTAFTSAVGGRDLPTVVAITMIFLSVYIVVNFLADVAQIVSNPRLRRAQ